MATSPKAPDAFRTIGEVAEWLGVETHVLRFWESKFADVKPVKRAGGRRYYRPEDMELLGGLKQLLHEDGMTIRGAQKVLAEKGAGHVRQRSKPVTHAPAMAHGRDATDPAQPALPFEPAAPARAEGKNGRATPRRCVSETSPRETTGDGATEGAADTSVDPGPKAQAAEVTAAQPEPPSRPDATPSDAVAVEDGTAAGRPADAGPGGRSAPTDQEAPDSPRHVPPVAPLPEPERSLPEAAARLMPHEIPRAELLRVLERARALRRRMDEST